VRLLRALALVCGLSAHAAAAGYFTTPIISTQTGTAWASISGQYYLAASSNGYSFVDPQFKSTWTITLDGTTGRVTALFFKGDGSQLTNLPISSSTFVSSTTFANTIASFGVTFSTISAALNTKLSSGAIPSGFVNLSTVTAALALKVNKAGDTMTGGLVMSNSSITLTGSNGYITSASSINASAFFGNSVSIGGVAGATLSCTPTQTIINTILSGGIITGGVCGTAGGGGGTAIGWREDDFTAAANGVTQDFTFSAGVSNSSGVFIVRDGLTLRPNADYVFTPPTSLHMNVAPAALTSSFFATYTVNLASGPLAAVLSSTQTFSGQTNFTQTVTFSSNVIFSQGQPALLAATQTFSGANDFTGLLRFSSGAFTGAVWTSVDSAGNARWQSPASSAGSAVSSSTINSIPTTSFTNTAPNGCFLAGSSVTISCDGSHPVECHGTLTMNDDTNGNFASVYILNNGQYLPGSLGSRHGQAGFEQAIGNRNYDVSINYTSTGNCTAGAQTFCLGALVSGGTGRVDLADVFPNNWACKEVH